MNLNPGSPRHLWVVASAPNAEGEIAIFNLTTERDDSDKSCVVMPGEHPFVKQRSVVAYARGRLLGPAALQGMQRLGCYASKEITSPRLLQKIQEGALRSPFTAGKLKVLIQVSI